jgi:protein-S-isoprenylcysteine O-methyltransferase Ste14
LAVRAGRVQPVNIVRPTIRPAATEVLDHGSVARSCVVALAPAIVLGMLGVSQFAWILKYWADLIANPSLISVAVLTRSVLYGAFVFGAAIALVVNRHPRSRDDRWDVIAISLIASFLMVGVNMAPVGPILWNPSALVTECGVVVTAIGASVAAYALVSLGRNFSLVPEARDLVSGAIYGVVRHPIYLAESLMIVGALVGDAQLTALIGTVIVIGLQIYRIRVEESLLGSAFPASFAAFTRRTKYRLIPLVW